VSLHPQRRRLAITAAIAATAVIAMVGLSFAAVPLYKAFCQATGYGGVTQRAAAAPKQVLDRMIEVRFDANVSSELPVEFVPEQRAQRLRLGESGVAFFSLHNLSDKPVTGVASFNVAPNKAGRYFVKLECFCFQPRQYAPGETARLAVVYYVDPELASDVETEEVQSLTLSYTYFRSVDEAAAALENAS
jgi:cytochrome c oxidase assembly protein subunit 11